MQTDQGQAAVYLRGGAKALVAIEIWPVALAVAVSMISARVLPWVLGVAMVFWIARYLAYGAISIRTPADGAIALLGLTLPASLWLTALPHVTRPAIFYVLVGIALYYAIVNWTTSFHRLRLLTSGLVATGLLLALSAPFSVDWTVGSKSLFRLDAVYTHFPPLAPDLIHPNVMAGPLMLIFPVPLALLACCGSRLAWRDRLLAGITVLAISSVVLLTQSRGGLLALGTTLAVLIVLRWHWLWLMLMVSALIGVIILWNGHTDLPFRAFATGNVFEGFDERLMLWSWALDMIREFPWTGIGMGTFETIAAELYAFPVGTGMAPHAHNVFLQVAVDLGLPGLVAWIAIVVLAMIAGWRVYRYGRSGGNSWFIGLGAGLLCSQAALVTHGLVDSVTWGVEPAVITWALWGLTMAAWNLTEREHKQRDRRELSG